MHLSSGPEKEPACTYLYGAVKFLIGPRAASNLSNGHVLVSDSVGS